MCLRAERIRELRVKRGLTQEEAAALAKVGSKQAWSNLENGRDGNVTLDRLKRIAEALGVRPRDLVE